MGKSQESFSKKEREKKKARKRKEKEQRKAERKEGEGYNEFAYVDEYGNLTDTPPDPKQKDDIEAEDIVLGVPKKGEEEAEDPVHKGKVEYFNDAKGFGFIKDQNRDEKYFVHISGMEDEVQEGDKVSFELERGAKGMNAVKVKKI